MFLENKIARATRTIQVEHSIRDSAFSSLANMRLDLETAATE